MGHQLCSRSDRHSFLLKALAFNRSSHAKAFQESAQFRDLVPDGCSYPAVFLDDGSSYVLTESCHASDFDVSVMFPEPAPKWRRSERRNPDADRIKWVVLRDRDAPKPEGSYNMAFMVEGHRQFNGGGGDKDSPIWLSAAVGGPRDAFTVWGRCEDGSEPPHTTILSPELRFYAGRTGRGVIYVREKKFDDNAEPRGVVTTVTLVEFAIRDRDRSKDDCMQVTIDRMPYFEPGAPGEQRLDDIWKRLIDEAAAGFARFCQPVTEEVEMKRVAFLEQMRKYQHDPDNFLGVVVNQSWQECLALVQEPYQLQMIIKYHCTSSKGGEFDDSPRFETNQTRVSRMLARHQCTEERRTQLQSMVGFTACQDRLWHTTGD